MSEIAGQATAIWVRNWGLSVSMGKEIEEEEESKKIEHGKRVIEFGGVGLLKVSEQILGII